MTVKPFRFLPHTADAEFQAFGKTLEEVFKNSGKALTNVITDVTKVKSVKKENIVVEADDLEDLLVDFLSELLYMLETKGFLYADAEDLKIEKKGEKYFLEASVLGDSVKNCETHGHVKAVTYHDLKIEKTKNDYMIQVVVDV